MPNYPFINIRPNGECGLGAGSLNQPRSRSAGPAASADPLAVIYARKTAGAISAAAVGMPGC